MTPAITTFAWVPEFARGFVRDLRPRWAFEEVGQPYEVELIRDGDTPRHRCRQPFGQVPTYRDDTVEIFESGAIVLHIAERAGKLIPADPAARIRAIQWLACALNSVEPWVMALAVNDLFEPIAIGRRHATQRSSRICAGACAILRTRSATGPGSTGTPSRSAT